MVLEPTSFSKPEVGAALKRSTASWASANVGNHVSSKGSALPYCSLMLLANRSVETAECCKQRLRVFVLGVAAAVNYMVITRLLAQLTATLVCDATFGQRTNLRPRPPISLPRPEERSDPADDTTAQLRNGPRSEVSCLDGS